MMRLGFLFWNIRGAQGTGLGEILARFADSGIDVFMFAEAPRDTEPLLAALNASTPELFARVESNSSRVRFFTRQRGPLRGAIWKDRFFDEILDRVTAIELQPRGALSILIVGAHLDSPATGISLEGRADWARDLALDIKTIEGDARHSRTILVGDLNMNPFDEGLVSASALHGVMSRDLTVVVTKHQARHRFPVFYNPMWSCFGDRPSAQLFEKDVARSPGTYYFDNTNDRANHFWQMYDQVLLRPELMNKLTKIEILRSDGSEPLVTKNGRPRKAVASDHLPVYFELDL
jgi:Endonuclease/Exonuclease/phosphatase family